MPEELLSKIRSLRNKNCVRNAVFLQFWYCLSPFSDNIRLVRNESSGPMFKDVVSEDEFARITQSMNSGEEVRYTLILANVNKKGLQKVEFTIKKR